MEKIVSSALRPCATCGREVVVAYGRESLRPELFEVEESMVLLMGPDGVFSLRRGKVSHVCPSRGNGGIDNGCRRLAFRLWDVVERVAGERRDQAAPAGEESEEVMERERIEKIADQVQASAQGEASFYGAEVITLVVTDDGGLTVRWSGLDLTRVVGFLARATVAVTTTGTLSEKREPSPVGAETPKLGEVS